MDGDNFVDVKDHCSCERDFGSSERNPENWVNEFLLNDQTTLAVFKVKQFCQLIANLLSVPMPGAAGLDTTLGMFCFLVKNWPGLGCRHEASAPMNRGKINISKPYFTCLKPMCLEVV